MGDDVESVLSNELGGVTETESEHSSEDNCSPVRLKAVDSRTSMSSDDVAQLRDFSDELAGTTYAKDYINWRRGHARGAKGDFHQAVADIEAIRKQLFLEGDDWSSVHTYRSDYQNWRRGKCRGAKEPKSTALAVA